jgi:RNA methyltransferase, TrmH family
MRVTEISSKDNPVFRTMKKLLTSKGIKDEKCFLLMGEKLISEFLGSKIFESKNPLFKIKNVISFDETPFPLLQTELKLKKELFDELDVLGTHYPMLLLEYFELKEPQLLESPQGLEIISPLGDPKNLGALSRSALGFGASKIILTKESCHPYLPHVIKASAGAILNIPIYYTPKDTSELPLVGENFALNLHGQKVHDLTWPKNLRLWVGEEGPGLKLSMDQKRKIKMITIPTSGIESLNATVSTSIAMWEWKKRN